MVLGALSRSRDRLRRSRTGSWLLHGLVFVTGAVFIALGAVLIVLPGPLTIPPVLLGLYIWSTEFSWAERLRDRTAEKGRLAWAAARRRPLHASAATATGLLLLGAGVVAAKKYDVVDRVMSAFG